MATISSVLSALSTKLGTLTSGTRMGSDIRRDLEAIASGATKFQIRHSANTVDEDSNQTVDIVALEIDVHRYLSGSESTYTAGNMLTYQDSLTDDTTLGWWLTISGVRAIMDGPETKEPTRVGNVVSFTVNITVSVEP